MPTTKKVTVHSFNGQHKCVPLQTKVEGGDLVHWTNGSVPIIFDPSPFQEGTAPLNPGTTSTVKMGVKGPFKGRVKVGGQFADVD